MTLSPAPAIEFPWRRAVTPGDDDYLAAISAIRQLERDAFHNDRNSKLGLSLTLARTHLERLRRGIEPGQGGPQ